MRISGVTFTAKRSYRARNITLTAVILVLLALLAIVIVSGSKSWALLHPDKRPLDTFSSNIVPEFRDISFKGSDKTIILRGWLFQAKDSDRAVILVHGYGQNRLPFGMQTIDLIKELLSHGYSVFTFDLRNSGESGGKDTTFGCSEKEDILAAIRYVMLQDIPHITLMGFSTGASASIVAAAESSAVDAVIADSPYADLNEYLRTSLNKWTHLPAFPFNGMISFFLRTAGELKLGDASPVSSAGAGKPGHLLLIHGRNDARIPIENSYRLYQSYSSKNPSGAEFWQTDDSGDAASFVSQPEEYTNRVLTFLAKVYP